MNREGPAYRYYASLEGSYLGELRFRVTSWTALQAAPLGLLARMRVSSMAAMPGGQMMATTLACDKLADGLALHTTQVAKWRATVATTRETIAIDADGCRLHMVGTQAMWPTLGRNEPYEAIGEIDATGTRASYSVPWLGTAMIDQRTQIVPGGLHLTQDTPCRGRVAAALSEGCRQAFRKAEIRLSKPTIIAHKMHYVNFVPRATGTHPRLGSQHGWSRAGVGGGAHRHGLRPGLVPTARTAAPRPPAKELSGWPLGADSE
jgi:hypothetical protein